MLTKNLLREINECVVNSEAKRLINEHFYPIQRIRS